MTKRSKTSDFVGYLRVSTVRQEEEGYGLNIQEQIIRSWALENERAHTWIFHDAATGRGLRSFLGRAGLQDALRTAKDLDLDLVVPSISRLSRDLSVLKELEQSGVNVISVLEGGKKVSKANLRALIKKAETEGANIAKRTRDALAAAKSRGVALGNKSNLQDAQKRGATNNVVRADAKVKELADFLEKNQNWPALSKQKLVDLLNLSGPLNLISERRSEREAWRVSTLRKPLQKAIDGLEFRLSISEDDIIETSGDDALVGNKDAIGQIEAQRELTDRERLARDFNDDPAFGAF